MLLGNPTPDDDHDHDHEKNDIIIIGAPAPRPPGPPGAKRTFFKNDIFKDVDIKYELAIHTTVDNIKY